MCYPSMLSAVKLSQMQQLNHWPGKLDTLSQHAGETNHRLESQTCYPNMHIADKLSQHALQNMHCIKEAAKAQNSGQADTVK